MKTPLWFEKWLSNDYAHLKADVAWIKWLVCVILGAIIMVALTLIWGG